MPSRRATTSTGSGWWQATAWPTPGSTSSGTSSAHTSVAFQQRVRKRHPDGGSVGVGGSPSSTMRRRPRSISGSGIGAADSSAWVYGWAEAP